MMSFLLLSTALAWGQSQEAIDAQRTSVETQREAVGRYRAAAARAVGPEPSCEPLPETELVPMIESASRKQQLPARLVRAVAAQESAFRPCALSKKGAQGLMQLMPATAEQLGVQDPF